MIITVAAEPTVELVLRFEELPPGSLASRRAVVRWSDGTEGEALRWYGDEVLVREGDLGECLTACLHERGTRLSRKPHAGETMVEAGAEGGGDDRADGRNGDQASHASDRIVDAGGDPGV